MLPSPVASSHSIRHQRSTAGFFALKLDKVLCTHEWVDKTYGHKKDMIWDCGEVQGAPSHRHRLLAALQERSAQGWMHGRWRLVLLLSVVPTLWARLRTVIELGGARLPRQQGGVDFFFEFLIRRPQAHGHRRTQPHTPPSPPSPSPPSSRLLTSARRPRLRRPRLPPSSPGNANGRTLCRVS
jgi:hypothetical protein